MAVEDMDGSTSQQLAENGPRPNSESTLNLKKVRKEMIVDLTAGSVGGIACVYAGQPFDTVKVKMQISQMYKSSYHCMQDMVKKDGFKSFYAGSTPALVANIGENGVLFLCYGQCKKIVQIASGRDINNMNAFHQACAGSLASFFSSFVLCPLELIKCRLQTARELGPVKKKSGPSYIIQDILRNDGLLGFYRGFVGTLAREMPGYFFFFGGYEATQYALSPTKDRSNEPMSLWRTVVSGGVGGMSLWATVYPADVIKSRSQVETGKSYGFFQYLKMIIKEEGLAGLEGLLKLLPQNAEGLADFEETFFLICETLKASRMRSLPFSGFGPRALYRGVVPCLLRAFPANAALFVAYEWTKKILR